MTFYKGTVAEACGTPAGIKKSQAKRKKSKTQKPKAENRKTVARRMARKAGQA